MEGPWPYIWQDARCRTRDAATRSQVCYTYELYCTRIPNELHTAFILLPLFFARATFYTYGKSVVFYNGKTSSKETANQLPD